MMKTLMLVLVFALFILVPFAFADSTDIAGVQRAQRIDTLKATYVPPSWRLYLPTAKEDTVRKLDTNYLKRNGFVWMRCRMVNPGSVIVFDTIIVWRPNVVGIDTFKFAPDIHLRFVQNK